MGAALEKENYSTGSILDVNPMNFLNVNRKFTQEGVTEARQFYEWILVVMSWKDWKKTLSVLIAISVSIYIQEYLTAAICLILFIPKLKNQVISSIMSRNYIENNPNANEEESLKTCLNKNFAFIELQVSFVLETRDSIYKYLDPSDKKPLREILDILKWTCIPLILIFRYCPLYLLTILAIWGTALSNLPQFKDFKNRIQKKLGMEVLVANPCADLRQDNIEEEAKDPIQKMQDNIEKNVLKHSKYYDSMSKQLNIPSSKKLVTKEKSVTTSNQDENVYEVFENERFYIFAGFSPKTMLGDNWNWSDSKGDKSDRYDQIQSPGPGLVWNGDWEVSKSVDTDTDGWMYALSFIFPFHDHFKIGDTVRKRKWTRPYKKA